MSDRVNPAKRILCYSPYTMWELHGMWETTILHALKLRGFEVSYTLCDGLFKDCDLFWATTYGYPRPENACRLCQHRVTGLMLRMNMDYQWLGRYLQAEDFSVAAEWSDNLQPEQFLTASYGDWPLGDWVESSVRSHFRTIEFDFDNPAHVNVFRHYLHGGLLAAIGLTRQFDAIEPDVVLLFNGRMATLRIALEIARRRGIETYTHERGHIKEAISLYHNTSISMAHEEVLRYWKAWENIPLSTFQLKQAMAYMRGREFGQNLSWIAMTAPPDTDLEPVRKQLGLSVDRPVWVLFPSSEDEYSNDRNMMEPFDSQQDWIDTTIAFAAEHAEIDLIIRVHPNIGAAGYKSVGITGEGTNAKQYAYFKQLMASQLPANIHIIDPDASISSYSLMNLSTAGMSLLSTTALELACKGRPVIVGAQSYIGNTPYLHTVHSKAEYQQLMKDFLKLPPLQPDKNITRLAYRFAYYLYHRWALPFPLVSMPDAHTGVPAYQTLDEIAPGRQEHLERICDIITGKALICDPPRAFDLCMDDVAESAGVGLSPFPKVQPVVTEQVLQTPAVSECSPKLTVVIPCYNYGHYLADAVHSLLDQQRDDLEIIVVNDGSSDETAAVAEQLLRAYPEQAITVIHQPNSGQPAIPRNRGIQAARGEYVLCLDADDKLGPGSLQALSACLDAHPGLSIAYPRLREFGNSHLLWAGQAYDPQLLLHWNFIPTAAMFRRQAWLDAGGYKTNVISHEDWDFWIACLEAGHFGQLVEAATFYYRIHGEGLLDSKVKQRLQLKARLIQNHPRLYTALQQDWASQVLAEVPHVLGLTLDPSQMPRFEHDRPTNALVALIERWQKAMADPHSEIRLQRTGLVQSSLYLRQEPRSGWRLTSQAQAEVLDWWPNTPLPKTLPDQIWVASQSAADLLRQMSPEITPRCVPRFVPEQFVPNSGSIEIENSACLLVVLNPKSDWQSQMTLLLGKMGPDAKLSLALKFEALTAEQGYDLLITWLGQTGKSESELPELVLLDDVDVQPADCLQAPVKGLWLDPNADPALYWFSAILAAGLPLLGPEPAPEWQAVLEPAGLPDWLQDYLPTQTLCFQATSQAISTWNARVWEQMEEASALA